MPVRYADMTASEMEYEGGNGYYRKNKKKVNSTPESNRMAIDYTLGYITLAFGIMTPSIWAIPATCIGAYSLGRGIGWW